MTVFTKTSMLANKAEITKIPLVQEALCPEAKIAVPPSAPPPRPQPFRRALTMLFHFMNISLLLMLFIAIGVLVYRQLTRTNWHRYQGYCAVPIDIRLGRANLMEPDMRLMPLHWSSEPDLQVISSTDDNASEEFVNVLREELDIDGMVEKISVLNNGHQVNFIHDFSTNTTNIIDTDRCFTMELDPELVLVPEAFVLSIERGGEFDVTRVRSALRALLPAVRDMQLVPPPCRERPTYRLHRADHFDHFDRFDLTVPVRKRSVDAPSHDFMHFSGKHVHEIEIGNMEELLRHEKEATA